MSSAYARRGMGICLLTLGVSGISLAGPTDPGIRRTPTDNGPPTPMPGLGQDELDFFDDGLARFQTVEVVSGASAAQGNGLGPRSIPIPAFPVIHNRRLVAAARPTIR